MSLEGTAVSLGAAVLSGFFAAIVIRSFLERREPYNLMWGVGLAMFTLVMLVQVVAELAGWTEAAFKAWYLLGTGLVAFLGAGSVYIVHRQMGHVFAVYVVGMFPLFLAFVVSGAVNAQTLAGFDAGAHPSGEAWISVWPRRMSPFFTIPGSVTLIGIALYGLVRYRLRYNAYIAAGAIVLAVGTGLARFGIPSLIYAAEFAGVALMFFGFWRAVEWAKARREEPARGGGPPPTKTDERSVVVETAPK